MAEMNLIMKPIPPMAATPIKQILMDVHSSSRLGFVESLMIRLHPEMNALISNI
jgi:hypothetical protein